MAFFQKSKKIKSGGRREGKKMLITHIQIDLKQIENLHNTTYTGAVYIGADFRNMFEAFERLHRCAVLFPFSLFKR